MEVVLQDLLLRGHWIGRDGVDEKVEVRLGCGLLADRGKMEGEGKGGRELVSSTVLTICFCFSSLSGTPSGTA